MTDDHFAAAMGQALAEARAAVAHGDVRHPVYMRSSAKPFQAMVFVLSGANGSRITTISSTGTQNADFQFTGGTLFNRVSQFGVGFIGVNTGNFSVSTMFVPQTQRNQGYFGMSDTKLDVTQPVATESSTWGRIKNLY